jgi:hypothetical protein
MSQNTVGFNLLNTAITLGDSAVLDAFSRFRVSNPVPLLSVQSQYDAEPLLMEANKTSDGVVPAFDTAKRMTLLKINSGATGGTSYLQSYQYTPYQPGKSQRMFMTGVFGAATAGAVKRFGYGDANNGIFLEQNGTSGMQVNRRTSTSGSVVDNTVVQSSWNIDHMDGTGPSGITFDVTQSFILVIDLQFLGMGRVRIGLDINGVVYYFHQFLNANVISLPYMQSASLPIIAEITAAAGLGGNATSYFKCSDVSTEGGEQIPLGYEFSTEGTVTAASGSRTHVLTIRPLTTFNSLTNHTQLILESIQILSGANPILYELVIGAAFSGAPTYANVNTSYSAFEAGTGGTFSNLSSGLVIAAGYVATAQGSNGVGLSRTLSVNYPITLDKSGAVRALGTLSVLLTGIGGTSASRVSLNWRELR